MGLMRLKTAKGLKGRIFGAYTTIFIRDDVSHSVHQTRKELLEIRRLLIYRQRILHALSYTPNPFF